MSVPLALRKEVADLQHKGLLFRLGLFALVCGVTVLGRFDCIWSLCDQMLRTYSPHAKTPVREPASVVLL